MLYDQEPTVSTINSPSLATIHMRPAEATESDAHAFARFALLAAHPMFNHHVGNYSYEMMRRLYLHDNNHFSHDKTAFMIVDDDMAGAISGYTHHQKLAQEARTALLVIRILTWRLIRAALVDLYYVLHGIRMAHTRSSDYYIQIVAIDANYRGQRLSYCLLQHAETIAQQHNCIALTLDVAADNPIAIYAYQSFGFEIVSKSPPRKPVIYQMRKQL